MKKIVIAVTLFLVIGLTALIVPLSLRFDTVQYEKDMLAHVISCNEGDLIAEYEGQRTRVLGRNISRIASTLSPAARKRLLWEPAIDLEQAAVIRFPDGAVFTIAESEAAKDQAYVVYRHKGRSRYFSITGYNTFSWIIRAISLEGVYNENEQLTSGS
ncbi:MAG: hypothetical protein SCM11_16490 [Bacillota bacterium]|nr:hypothetical protein [Bacillota bacterium]